jgi:hypothetical protein
MQAAKSGARVTAMVKFGSSATDAKLHRIAHDSLASAQRSLSEQSVDGENT